jgi:hypothetical protein
MQHPVLMGARSARAGSFELDQILLFTKEALFFCELSPKIVVRWDRNVQYTRRAQSAEGIFRNTRRVQTSAEYSVILGECRAQ